MTVILNEIENQPIANSKLIDVFKLFVGVNESRQVLHKPFEFKDKVYASDKYTLVRIDKKNCDFVLDNEHPPIKCDNIVPSENMNVVLNIDKSTFEKYKTEDEFEYIGENIDCSTCEENGTVEWKFERWKKEFDCPMCDGSGYSQERRSRKTGNKTFGFKLVNMMGVYFDVNKFYKLIKVHELIGCEIVLISKSNPQSAVLFRIGNCEILLMPYNYENSACDYEVINI